VAEDMGLPTGAIIAGLPYGPHRPCRKSSRPCSMSAPTRCS